MYGDTVTWEQRPTRRGDCGKKEEKAEQVGPHRRL